MKKISLLTLNLFLASLFLTSNIFPDFLNYGDEVYLKSMINLPPGSKVQYEYFYLTKITEGSGDYNTTQDKNSAEKFIVCKSQSEIGSGKVTEGNNFVLKIADSDNKFLSFRDNGGWWTSPNDRFIATKSSGAIVFKSPGEVGLWVKHYNRSNILYKTDFSGKLIILQAVGLNMAGQTVYLWQNGTRFQFNRIPTEFIFEKIDKTPVQNTQPIPVVPLKRIQDTPPIKVMPSSEFQTSESQDTPTISVTPFSE